MINLEQALLTRPPADGPNRPDRRFRGDLADWITVHATGNPSKGADAAMHARWLNTPASKGGPEYAWHFTVDVARVVQTLPEWEQGWHAGDGLHGEGNTTSIGVELCMPGGVIPEATLERAAELVAMLRSRGHGAKGIVQHNRWSGKHCPAPLRDREGAWTAFLERVQEAERALSPPAQPKAPSKARKRVRYGAREAVAQATVLGAVVGLVAAVAELPHDDPLAWGMAAVPIAVPFLTQAYNAWRDGRLS